MTNSISSTANISKLADIETSSRGSRLIVSDKCFIDSFVKIKFSGGNGDIIIGEECFINSGSVLYSGNGITLGKQVLIAANCTLAPVNHNYSDKTTSIREQGFAPSKGGIVVDDDVWIGSNCTILDGAHIGKGVVIAAGSVVTGNIPPYTIYGGQPAKFLKKR